MRRLVQRPTVRRRRVALAAVLALALLAAGVGTAVVGSLGPDCTLPGLPDQPRPVFGLTVAGFPGDPGSLRAVTTTVGQRPDLVMWYVAWKDAADFPADAATEIRDQGAVPEITWEPWDPAAGPDQPGYSLQRIAQGAYDDYVRRWARQAREYGGPVWLRFAHEMNTATYPWSEVGGRNPAGSYVAAWRHLHRLFHEAGADNVSWVWSPNTPYDGTTPLSDLYPGDDAVDVVALDGYNWSTLQPGTRWQSFASVFDRGLGELTNLSDRPIVIGEVASTEQGGDKAAWITDMFRTLSRRSDICGFVWFDIAKETDWRIDSSTPALQAFRRGLAATRD